MIVLLLLSEYLARPCLCKCTVYLAVVPTFKVVDNPNGCYIGGEHTS